jgi:EAL domain-containing protein (putative c-di-GMP-specific phosphodiesterase class I)
MLAGRRIMAARGASTDRLVRVLVTVVVVECAIALVLRTFAAYRVFEGTADSADYLATVGVAWIFVLAVSGLLVARRLDALSQRVRAQDVDLEAMAEPRRRLAAIVHRTERMISTPGGIHVALQPIVDLESGRWVGVEALARFPDHEPPEQWFAEAHEAGMGVVLERQVLESALLTLPDLPPDVRLSINASPALIVDPAFHEIMLACGEDRERLTIEITEHAAVARYEDIRAALLPHRERGLRLAVDDTGAGYASFAHVLRLRPDVIKLDRSLLTDIAHDAARRAFVTAIVLLALELDAAVTAEGVETTTELDVLRSLGVDTVQGYLLARPSAEPSAWAAWASRNWPAHAGLVPPRRGGIELDRDRADRTGPGPAPS